MKVFKYFYLLLLSISVSTLAQNDTKQDRKPGHVNTNKFRQLYNEFSTPNMYRSASGAPGVAYYQQQADYKINVELDDENAKMFRVQLSKKVGETIASAFKLLGISVPNRM